MRCPIQSSLITRAKALFAVPFKHLPEWSDEEANIQFLCRLNPLNITRVDNDRDEGWRGVAPLPAVWVLDFIFDGDRSYTLESLCDEWNYYQCEGNASDEELELMEKMLEDWHHDLTRWMIDWTEYEASVLEEDWGKTWYLEDFDVNNN